MKAGTCLIQACFQVFLRHLLQREADDLPPQQSDQVLAQRPQGILDPQCHPLTVYRAVEHINGGLDTGDSIRGWAFLLNAHLPRAQVYHVADEITPQLLTDAQCVCVGSQGAVVP
ncbi:MAG: hypothetical protein DRI48_08760 [Chloroflexi bacterium]|nr:MAG: hypothetical protein DRI48_08760 [Chloroflexota bacterium]